MKRKLPQNLYKKQQIQREKTQQIIQEAINNLIDFGYDNITPNLIIKEIESSGNKLARSTLDKPHAVEILKKNEVWIYKNVKKIETNIKTKSKNPSVIITELQKELVKANEKNKRLEEKLELTEMKLKEKRFELDQEKIRQRETIGKFQALYEKAVSMGIKIKL